jgi:hypothetical protein
MSKEAGLGDRLFVGGYNLSGDIGSLGSISGGPATQDVTGIDVEAMERIGLLRDGRLEFSAFFNPTRAHPVLGALPTSDVVMTYCRGIALGGPAAALVAKQANYDGTRGADGSLTFSVQALANGYGLQWGRQGTAGIRTDTAATDGSSVDFGTGSTAFGLVAFLHVFAFTGTSVTVKIQESSDNGVGDAWADVTGGGFTAATGITAQRIATAPGQTVERYLRVVSGGTFSDAQFAVAIMRPDVATVF